MSNQNVNTASEVERKIFDAALRVFAQKGHDGARMHEIADEAGINRTLLHYYYRNKRALYRAVVSHAFGEFMESFGDALAATTTFEDALNAFIEGYIDYMSTHRDVLGVFVNENRAEGSIIGHLLREALASPEPTPPRIMSERIRSAVADGEIRVVDPTHTMLTIVSACLFFLVALPTVRILEPEAHDDFDAFLEKRKAHLFDLLYFGLAAREDSP